MTRRTRLVLAGLVVATGLVLVPATSAAAHPLGNFTVNTFDALRVRPDRVLVDAVVDRAEIPTSQLASSAGGTSPTAPAPAQQTWANTACSGLAGRLTLRVDAGIRPLTLDAASLRFLPGAGGLPTSRLTCRLSATGRLSGESRIAFVDGAIGDRVGWHEVTAIGDGATVRNSNVPDASVSAALTRYPADLLSSPLDVRGAVLTARSGGPTAADPLAGTDAPDVRAARRGVDRLTAGFTDLIGHRQLGIGVGSLAVVLALLLGGLHAFAPGHGKTVMAAYLVSGRGSLRQAAIVGLGVTATHTVGVLALGIALSVSSSVAPERVYPWLGLVSGLMLLAVGTNLLRGAWGRSRSGSMTPARPPADADVLVEVGAGHAHPHSHAHSHGHSHTHARLHPHQATDLESAPPGAPPLRRASLLAMGFVGGLVPSPSALVVLLSAIALHRAWFGVVLVVVYGAGMALTLVGIGAALARASGRLRTGPRYARMRNAVRILPIATSGAVVVLGILLALRGAAAL